MELAGDSRELRLELTDDDELVFYCLALLAAGVRRRRLATGNEDRHVPDRYARGDRP